MKYLQYLLLKDASGGKVDEGEDLISALDREVSEELGVKVKKSEPYITYISFQEEDGSTREVTCFFVEYEGEPKAKGEIEKMVWISRQDIKENKVKIQSGIADHLIPKLLKDGFL